MNDQRFLSRRGREAAAEVDRRITWYGSIRFFCRASERVLRLLLAVFAVILLTIWLEAVIGPSPMVSLLTRLVGVALIGTAGFFWVWPFVRGRPSALMMGAAIEDEVPGLANRLITAVEFRREMEYPDGGILRHFSPFLVNAFFLDTARTPIQPFWRRVLIRSGLLIQFIVLIAVICFFLGLHHFTPLDWGSALGIYFAPFHQDPFSGRTMIQVHPGNARITVGDNLSITIRVLGGRGSVPTVFFRSGETEPDEVKPTPSEDGVFSHEFTNIRQSMVYWVQVGRKKTREYTVTALEPIHLTDINLTYIYPAYTGLPSLIGEKNDGNIRSLIGTTVRISADFDQVASKAEAHFKGSGDEEGIATEDMIYSGKSWECRKTVRQDGSYRISAEWKEGAPGDSPTYTIEAVPDRAPTVRIVSPTDEVALLDDYNLPPCIQVLDDLPYLRIQYFAKDDLGLRRVRLLVRAEGKDLVEEKDVETFSSGVLSGTREFLWGVNDYWGGPDCRFTVQVSDALADSADSVAAFYSEEEIHAHKAESAPVHVYWNEPKKNETASEEDQRKQDRLRDETRQVKTDVEEIRDKQREVNEETKEQSEETGESGKDSTGGEGKGTAQGTEKATPKASKNGSDREPEKGSGRPTEKRPGNEGNGGPKEAGGSETGEGKGDTGSGLADQQKALAQKTGQTAESALVLADRIEESLKGGGGKGEERGEGKSGERPSGAGGERDLDGMKRLSEGLRNLAGRLGPPKDVPDGPKTGISDRMAENAERIRGTEYDGAFREGKKIEQDLTAALDAVDNSDLQKEGDGADRVGPAGKTGEKTEPGGKGNPDVETGEGTIGKKPDPGKVGDKGPQESGPDGDSQKSTGEKLTDGSTPNRIPQTLEARPGEGRRWGSLGAGAGNGPHDDNIVSIKFILPDSVPMDFGPGTGIGSAADYVGEKIDDGVVTRDVKIPPSYRKSVGRYYELIAGRKETE